MQQKHITWSLCLWFTVLHVLAVLAVLGLTRLAGLVLSGGGLLGWLAPGFGVLWSYIYVTTYNLGIPAYHCTECGYNLTGNVSGVCSECGGDI